MIDLDTARLNFEVRVTRLDVASPFFQILLEFSLEDPFTIRGDPNNMVLMVVCAVGTELDLHAHLVSKPLHENLSLRLRAFTPG